MRFVRPVGPIESASAVSAGAPAAQRQLGGSGDDGGYLVDSSGNILAPYSLSWRYLGIFLDSCSDNDNRKLGNNNNNYYCRKVLWAAYHDPGYGGQGIAEYSFYQRDSGSYDGSTCRAQTYGLYWPGTRCRRLDCHESNTKLELVGVFKETYGLYDFTEQLFKHQGYCLWDEDKNSDGESHHSGDGSNDDDTSDYQFMKNLAESWVSGCTKLEDVTDASGNALYYDTKPLPSGGMTYGVYTDSSCTIESTLTWSSVLSASGNNNGDSNDGNDMMSIDSLDRWNDLFDDFKICQPCRAYNRVKTSDGSSHNSRESEDSSSDYEDGDDGEGGKDRWGFNCYDDAGYQNCNMCYKFQTQTDMEPASSDDLERATAQGTILGVRVDGTHYGMGHYVAPGSGIRKVEMTSVVFVSTMGLVGLGYYFYGKKLHCRRRRIGKAGDSDSFEDNLNEDGWHSKRNKSSSRTANWMTYMKTAHRQICSDTLLLLAKLKPARSGMDTKSTTSSRTSVVSPRSVDRKKKYLVTQLKKKDAKLAEQDRLIQQLRQRLAHYESEGNKIITVSDVEEEGDGAVGGDDTDTKAVCEEAMARVLESTRDHPREKPPRPSTLLEDNEVKFTKRVV